MRCPLTRSARNALCVVSWVMGTANRVKRRARVIRSVGATHLLMASEVSDVVRMKAVPQTPQGPRAMAKCLHCVRTACILRMQRLGYSPKNTCHLFTRGKTERCQYHWVGRVSIDTSGCSYNQQHRRRRTVRSWCRLATIEYRRSRAFERR